MRVKKRNGRLEDLDVNKINNVVLRVCQGLDAVSPTEIIIDSEIQFYDKITTVEIDRSLVLTARSKIFKDPEYSKVAARLLLNCIYKEVLRESVDCDTFENDYKSAFIKNVKKQVKEGRLDKRCLQFDLKRMSETIDISRDFLFGYVGIQNIYDRYLLRDSSSSVVETPQSFYMRVAMGLSFNESNLTDKAIEFYHTFSQHLSSPSTPTLFNSATSHSQLSSCYLSELHDSVDGIFDGLWQEARKSKYAGGLGFHVTNIRAMGSRINGTDGESSGLIPWLKVYNDMLVACDQAGKRSGSGCAYLEPWHLDVEDFIDLRKETGEERRRTHDLNTALWCPDIFFERIEKDEKWTLFCPSEVSDLPSIYGENFNKKYIEYEKMASEGGIKNFREMSAKVLWKKILRSLFETSHPWITHKDNANYRYSDIHQGVLHGSNLCTEIFRHTKHSTYADGEKLEIGETAVCNLHSIVLPNHIEDGKINFEKLENTIEVVIRALDNVIDVNFYPTKEAKKSNIKHRPVGLGNMGFADVCHMLNIVQDSDGGIELADSLMEFISYHAILCSSKLAKEKGRYETYEGSKWSENKLPIDTYNELMIWKDENHKDSSGKLDWTKIRDHVSEYGMRNGSVMAIAPNASIAFQMGCEQSIEPNFSVLFTYENKSGNYYIINHHFVDDMKKENLWDEDLANIVKEHNGDLSQMNIPDKYKDKYKTAFDRDQFKLIEANARRHKWIDQGISFNSYNNKNSLKFLNDIYLLSNKLGLKSNYYLRNVSASMIEKVTSVNRSEKQDYNSVTECSLDAMASGGTCEMCEG